MVNLNKGYKAIHRWKLQAIHGTKINEYHEGGQITKE